MKNLNVLLCSAIFFAQLSFAADKPGDGTASNGTADQNGSSAPVAAVDASAEGPLSRWLDLNTASISLRYRNTFNSDSFHYFQFGQQRSLIDGRFKMDAGGKYSINFRVSSGRTFNWSYADVIGGKYSDKLLGALPYITPAQLAPILQAAGADPQGASEFLAIKSRGWQMYARQLYLSASPIKELEFDYGSLPIAKGYNSEITSYDEDGYITGERLRILDPKHLFVDEASVTFAYEGDIYNPNFFTRGNRLLQSNYHQFLIAKKAGKRLGLSADFTGDKGTHTFREGVLAKVPETRILDTFRLELYQRTNDVFLQGDILNAASGFSFTGTKTIAKRFRIEGGYADIDDDYAVLLGSRLLAAAGFSMNADTIGIGKRAFGRANVQITPYFSLFGFYTHLTKLDPNVLNLTNQGLNFGATFDFKGLLKDKLHLL